MKDFNPFEGAERNEELDQPRLVSGEEGYEDHAIPAQYGFILPNGTPVQVSYERAKELGLIKTQIVRTDRVDSWGVNKNV